MAVATMTSKGQITVPQVVREALGLRPGAKVDFVPTPEGFRLVAVQRDVATLKGRFAGRVARAVSLAEMDDAIAQAGADRVRPARQRKP